MGVLNNDHNKCDTKSSDINSLSQIVSQNYFDFLPIAASTVKPEREVVISLTTLLAS